MTAKLDPEGPATRKMWRQQFVDIYEKAGVSAVFVEELPNGYCSEPCCLNRPWFRITSNIGHVVIGWRKQVISIDWKDTLVKMTGEELFSNENVTKSERGIHAWGSETATSYIKKLHEAVVSLPQESPER